MSMAQLKKRLRQEADKEKAVFLQGFFKTGPGEYGEGDVFLGVIVPKQRRIAKEFADLSFTDLAKLMRSKFHEERLVALFILVKRYQKAKTDKDKQQVFDFYLRHKKGVNNWDLVDGSASYIVGAHLMSGSKKLLYELAVSKKLWDRRIAIIATHYFIRHDHFSDTLKLAKILLHDKEDLMHKAVGWMLREVGKRDVAQEEAFLEKHCTHMPRTMLRYAIEHFSKTKRQRYMKR